MKMNPIILGIIAAAVIYAIMYFTGKKDDKGERKRPDWKLPLIAGLLVWFISGKCMNSNVTSKSVMSNSNSNTSGESLAQESLLEELPDF